jgi:hypothetical protein
MALNVGAILELRMQDDMKTYGLWAGLGAALGIGIAVGMGLRFLATGAVVGIGAGAALGIASGLKSRKSGQSLARADEPPLLY